MPLGSKASIALSYKGDGSRNGQVGRASLASLIALSAGSTTQVPVTAMLAPPTRAGGASIAQLSVTATLHANAQGAVAQCSPQPRTRARGPQGAGAALDPRLYGLVSFSLLTAAGQALGDAFFEVVPEAKVRLGSAYTLLDGTTREPLLHRQIDCDAARVTVVDVTGQEHVAQLVGNAVDGDAPATFALPLESVAEGVVQLQVEGVPGYDALRKQLLKQRRHPRASGGAAALVLSQADAN